MVPLTPPPKQGMGIVLHPQSPPGPQGEANKSPLLFPAHPTGFTVGAEKKDGGDAPPKAPRLGRGGSTAPQQRRVRGTQCSSSIPKSMRTGEKKAAGMSRGTPRDHLSPSVPRACLVSALPTGQAAALELRTAAIHGRYSQWEGTGWVPALLRTAGAASGG